MGNGPSDQTHINDTLYLGATDSGDSHFYFGENSSSWYGDHWYWDSGYEVERYSRNAGTDTLIEKHDTRYTHKVQTNRAYERLSHSTGYQIGSYNTQGDNSAKTNPIYTIGDNYRPADTTLGNMYGIGFASNSSAAFLSGDLDAGADGWGLYVAADGDARIFLGASNGTIKSTGQHYANGSVVWNAGNDGASSGLDADLLDGQHGSYYYSPGPTFTGNVSLSNGNVVLGTASKGFSTSAAWLRNTTAYGYIEFGPANTSWAHIYTDRPAFYFNKEMRVNNQLVWNSGNDGSGTGLDADLLDGIQGASFLRSDAADTATGTITFSGAVNLQGNVAFSKPIENFNTFTLIKYIAVPKLICSQVKGQSLELLLMELQVLQWLQD